MDFSAKLDGFKELAAGLRELPQNLAKNGLRAGAAAGAAVFRVEVKKNAQAKAKSGTTARAVYQKQIRELSGPDRQTFYVGVRHGKKYQKVGKRGVNKDAYYFPFVELGHFTRPSKDGKPSRWVPPRPILRPAFDTKKDAAVVAVGEKIAQRLQTIKLGK